MAGVVVGGGEVGADLIGLGGAEADVESKGFLPVAAGLAGVAGRVAGLSEAVVGARLLVFLAALGCHAERGGVLSMSIRRPAGGEEHFTEAVERTYFTRLIADLTGHSQGLPLVIGGLLITALPQAGIAKSGEGARLTGSAADLAEQGQRPLEVSSGLPAVPPPQADFAQAGKGVALGRSRSG